MCGIFGFSYLSNNETNKFSIIENDIKLFTQLSNEKTVQLIKTTPL